MPLFSILIPTKNRAQLLRFALESLRRQTFRDFEVIISDDHSTDDTPQVVTSFGDERFRLVHPSKPLTMSEHYDFVASHALGEYINFLPDRNVFYSSALSALAEVIEKNKPELIGWNNDRYDDAKSERREFHQFQRSGKLADYSSADLIRLHYDFHLGVVNFSVASPASSACHRSLVDRIKKQTGGRLVVPHIPDITYSISVLAMSENFFYLDRSLSVGAGYAASIGSNLSRTREEGMRRLVGPNGVIGRYTPCKGLMLNSNLVADDLIALKEIYPEVLDAFELNFVRYFEKLMIDISNIEASGGDATREWQLFDDGLAKMSPEIQLHIGNTIWELRLKRKYPVLTRERVISCNAAPVLDAAAWSEANPF